MNSRYGNISIYHDKERTKKNINDKNNELFLFLYHQKNRLRMCASPLPTWASTLMSSSRLSMRWRSHFTQHTHTRTQHAHAHTHTNIHTYIHTYIHTCVHTYLHTCMHACMHTYKHIHIHVHIHTHTCVYECCVCAYVHMHICIRSLTRTRACIYKCRRRGWTAHWARTARSFSRRSARSSLPSRLRLF